jgi:hypothetical protein
MTLQKLQLCCWIALFTVLQATAQVTSYGTEAGGGGILNTHLGFKAGKFSTAEAGTFVGHEAGQNNTTGNSNSFIGTYSGTSNTSGGYNSFFGFKSGYQNLTGSFNSFFGTGSGNNNVSGGGNSFFGYQSGYKNINGDGNSFFGTSAGVENTSGSSNSFFGAHAGSKNSTGNYNSFVGYISGEKNSTGQYNSFFGASAGRDNTSGINNTFLGYETGKLNTSGGGNTLIGANAGSSITSYDNTIIGNNAGTDTYGSSNTFLGSYAGSGTGYGAENIYLGAYAGQRSTGSRNIMLGDSAGALNTGHNNIIIGNNAGHLHRESNKFIMGGYNRIFLYGDILNNKLAIGTSNINGNYTLNVNGNTLTSDVWTRKRPWTNTAPIVNALTKINQLRGLRMKSPDSQDNTFGFHDMNFSAVFPELSRLGIDSALNYQGLVPVLVEAIRELSTNVVVLTKRVAILEGQTNGFPIPSALSSSTARTALHQSTPNPANKSATIHYELSSAADQGSIYIFDLNGNEVKAFHKLPQGQGEVTIASTQLPAGLYYYSLVVNGSIVETKNMIIKKD